MPNMVRVRLVGQNKMIKVCVNATDYAFKRGETVEMPLSDWEWLESKWQYYGYVRFEFLGDVPEVVVRQARKPVVQPVIPPVIQPVVQLMVKPEATSAIQEKPEPIEDQN